MSVRGKQKVNKVVLTALFSAIICVLTMFPKLPVPLTNGGYIHIGDALIIVAAFCLSPIYAAVAAGVGSCLADLFSGYAIYMPATFVIKALTALIAALMFLRLKSKEDTLKLLLIGVVAEAFMTLGYFLFETILYGVGTAAVSVLFNLIQAASGAIFGAILIKLITSNSSLNNLLIGSVKK